MNVNKSNLFWGILLVGGGAIALAQQAGLITQPSGQVWTWIFALVSLLGLVSYALSGWKQWGWLFPTGVFGGLAVTAALSQMHLNDPAMSSPLFFGLLIPFAAAYLTDRTRNWWALIPGGVMLFLALTTLIVDRAGGEWVGSLFLFMIALGFLIVYLNNQTRSWALLVAYVMGVLCLAPAMASGGQSAAYFGPLFLFAIGLPFFLVYFRSADRWWAIIPAGTMTTLAIVAALAIAGWIRDENQGGYANALLTGGLAVTFAVVWLRDHKPWAQAVTIILAVLAIASVSFARSFELFWPVAIILGGVYLFYSALRPKTA